MTTAPRTQKRPRLTADQRAEMDALVSQWWPWCRKCAYRWGRHFGLRDVDELTSLTLIQLTKHYPRLRGRYSFGTVVSWATRWTAHRLAATRSRSVAAVSLAVHIGRTERGESLDLLDMVADPHAPDPVAQAEVRERADTIRVAVARLERKQRAALERWLAANELLRHDERVHLRRALAALRVALSATVSVSMVRTR
jgi:hypothetical protein